MSVSILTRQIKYGCVFNAVGNPIVYSLQRGDYAFTQINSNAGNSQLQIAGVTLGGFFQVGDEVYVNATGYNKKATVTAFAFTGTVNLITVNIPFVSTQAGKVNNLSKRSDYKMSIKVMGSDGVQLGAALEYSTPSDGIVKINVAGILRSYLGAEWERQIIPNKVEPLTSKEFYISIAEYYDTILHAYVDDSQNLVAVFAVKQLLFDTLTLKRNQDGGNMVYFEPNNDTRLWLTRFAITGDPVPMWRDYPFSLSFLWPDDVPVIMRKVVQKDAQGNTITTATDSLLPTVLNSVHRMILPPISTDTATLEVTLVNATFASLIGTLIIEVRQACKNPVHLFWKNSYGGDSYYQFEFNQEYGYVPNTGKKAQRLTMFASDLRISEWEALNELNSPTEVLPKVIPDLFLDETIDKTAFRDDQQVYVLNASGSVKIGAVVVASTVKTFTKLSKHSFDIEIELPEIFVI
jgi:hypothetical protein